MEDENNVVLAYWEELKVLANSLELDVLKNARGVAAAGVRTRKGLRGLKVICNKLIKKTVELDKLSKAARPKKAKKEA